MAFAANNKQLTPTNPACQSDHLLTLKQPAETKAGPTFLMSPDYEGVKTPPLFQLPNYDSARACSSRGHISAIAKSFPILSHSHSSHKPLSFL